MELQEILDNPMLEKPKISLCMFARDEGETIGKALESAKQFCDEIVIGIDNASKDNTEEIAKEYADTLYHFDWKGSFSEARNLCMSKATHKWIFIMDAHEVIEDKDIEKIIEKLW